MLREVRRVMRRAATGRGASTGNGLLVAPVMAPGCRDPVGEFPDDAVVHVVGADAGAACRGGRERGMSEAERCNANAVREAGQVGTLGVAIR